RRGTSPRRRGPLPVVRARRAVSSLTVARVGRRGRGPPRATGLSGTGGRPGTARSRRHDPRLRRGRGASPVGEKAAEGPDGRIGRHATAYPQVRRRVPGHVRGLRFFSKGDGFDSGSGLSRRVAGVRGVARTPSSVKTVSGPPRALNSEV